MHKPIKNIYKSRENSIIVQIMYCTKLDLEFANHVKCKICTYKTSCSATRVLKLLFNCQPSNPKNSGLEKGLNYKNKSLYDLCEAYLK